MPRKDVYPINGIYWTKRRTRNPANCLQVLQKLDGVEWVAAEIEPIRNICAAKYPWRRSYLQCHAWIYAKKAQLITAQLILGQLKRSLPGSLVRLQARLCTSGQIDKVQKLKQLTYRWSHLSKMLLEHLAPFPKLTKKCFLRKISISPPNI